MGAHRVYHERKYVFGQQLLTLRTRAALTQIALASKIGVHPSKLSLVLNERQPLPPELATRIAEALQEL